MPAPAFNPTPDQRPPAVQQSSDTLSSSAGTEKDDFGAAREGGGENKPGAPLIIPWRVKGRALVMVLLLNLGTYWFSAAVGPLKTTIKQELGINNAQYGVLASANHLVNTIVPFFSGVLIDYYGGESCSLVASSIILIGALLSGGGAQASHFGLLVAGEVIVGFGSITIQTAQIKLLSHWFHGLHFGMAMGLEQGVNRVVQAVAKATAIPIVESSDSWAWAIWVSTFLSAFVLAANVAYVLWVRTADPLYRPKTGRQAAKLRGDVTFPLRRELGNLTFSLRASLETVRDLPAFFWILAITQIMQNGAVQAYISLEADLLKETRGSSLSKAGWVSAVGQVPVIVLAPLLGLFIDRFGYRLHFIPASSVFFIVVFCLMGFTQTPGIALTVLKGLGITINIVPVLMAIPLLCPSPAIVGTAQGTYQAFMNSGSVIVSTASGAIQDRTPTGTGTYSNVLYFFIALKVYDFFIGIIYIYLEHYKMNGILGRSEGGKRRRDARLAEGDEVEVKGSLREPSTGWLWAGMIIGVALTLVAWVVYLVYSQGS